ncbi:leucine-rich repeat (LRR) family protein [Artemisia annua]|uniref:Leucine-rich repeat (LRR) family protein n=1 Tax=Artemisia annua TaxID=35608 RepID=A0A2U1P3Z6_ARTAN|nr:leucine-rich repeat (LRR) family protein [Artemisia annua]
MESPLVRKCIEAATQSGEAVETWRRQRRTLERLPSHLAEALLHRLLNRRLLHPSLLEVFKYSVEKVDLRGESSVDAEWMAYLGAFKYLHSLNVSDCHRINSSALWALSGMSYLKELDLSRCNKFNDAGIKHLLSIRTIEKLCISETSVTTNGVILLSSLKRLSKLDLGGLFIHDEALASLQVLTNLQHLDLWGSDISNEGASILVKFPNLNFLTLAWTKVTVLPNVSSVKCLNMSNCTIHSLFKGEGNKARLTQIVLAGASFKDVKDAFSYFDSSCLSFLDLSNSSLRDLYFLPCVHVLEYLDLSGNLIGDDSAEYIASVGANLKSLNLSNTRVSSAGVAVLTGHVPKLEIISLDSTPTDDLALSYIGMIPSLKSVSMKGTNVRGLIQQNGRDAECTPSLTALENLKHLEKLNLEDIPLRDEAITPISNFKQLNHLSLRSTFLTDASLHHLSSVNLITLGMQDAVLTNAGIDCFNAPSSLEVLDINGCWLLTKDAILSFLQCHPEIEIRHELVSISLSDSEDAKYHSPSQTSMRTSQQRRFSSSPLKPEMTNIIDQRLKYNRAELLSLRFASTLVAPPSD